KRWDKGAFVVKIDHHESGDDFADLPIVYPEAAATAEIVSNLILDFGIGTMTAEAAKLLYSGIVTDTGGFRFSVSPCTFETAAMLVSYGFNAGELTERLFLRTRKEAELSGVLCGMIKMTPSGAAYLRLDRDVISAFGMTREEAGDTVNLMLGIDGIPVWAVFIGETDGTYHVRLRGRGANVRIIAEKFGGGGHDGASGAHLDSEEKIPAVIAELDRTAKDVLDKQNKPGYNI
ncbi:MAG: DHH family phosphoesterase, partial [Clostridia bacterium]|nr:DHH family phosphoesterase [Clostridia bacterium]